MARFLDTSNPFNANAPGTEGLVAWLVGLPPRDGGGTLYDETGLTRGAASGSIAWSPTPQGDAGFNFKGGTDSATLSDFGGIPVGANAITIAASVFKRTETGDDAIFNAKPSRGSV